MDLKKLKVYQWFRARFGTGSGALMGLILDTAFIKHISKQCTFARWNDDPLLQDVVRACFDRAIRKGYSIDWFVSELTSDIVGLRRTPDCKTVSEKLECMEDHVLHKAESENLTGTDPLSVELVAAGCAAQYYITSAIESGWFRPSR